MTLHVLTECCCFVVVAVVVVLIAVALNVVGAREQSNHQNAVSFKECNCNFNAKFCELTCVMNEPWSSTTRPAATWQGRGEQISSRTRRRAAAAESAQSAGPLRLGGQNKRRSSGEDRAARLCRTRGGSKWRCKSCAPILLYNKLIAEP
jgi:hypothetical protein